MSVPPPHQWQIGEEAGTPLGPGLLIGKADPGCGFTIRTGSGSGQVKVRNGR